MSKIDDQIKELILKKKKVELLQWVVSSIESNAGEDYTEVKDEIVQMVKAFVDAQSEMIAEGRNSTLQTSDLQFAVEEFQILQDMARKLIQKSTAPQVAPINTVAPKIPQDKVGFALAHKHFESKRVRVSTNNGPVDGSVVGIDAPYIVVRTDTHYTVSIEPQNLQII